MKKIFLGVLLVFLASNLGAEDRTFAGYKTYSPQNILVKVMPSPPVWESLKTVRSLMKPNTFQFLNRRDPDHWIGLTKVPAGVVLHIHDQSSQYNFKALVNLTTGRITVMKAVDYAGHSREDDALYAAGLALGYLERLKANLVIYPDKPAKVLAVKPVDSKKAVMTGIKAGAKPGKAPEVKPSDGKTESKKPGAGTEGAKELSALERLMAGNKRFAAGKPLHQDQDLKRVAETSQGQHPFAVVVTCSDSRLPPEVLFDQGVGDLFVVRTAGEVVGPLELASIEYAVEHLKVPYLVVMGHKKCGAVDAAIKGGDLSVDLQSLVKLIEPAVTRAKDLKGDLLDNAVHENITQVLGTIKTSEIVAKAMEEGKLNLAGAYYDIDTGKVEPLN